MKLHYKAVAVVATTALLPCLALAQSMPPKGSIFGPAKFDEQGGAAVYKAICQGCHMPGATGAAGAGAYPALAHNPNLAAASYPILRVLYGQGAMPSFRAELDDQQIADVVTYVRSNFENAYPGKVTAADVKALRRGGLTEQGR